MTIREQYKALYRAERVYHRMYVTNDTLQSAREARQQVIKGNWSMQVMDAARTSYVQAKHIHFSGWLNSGSRHLQSRRKIQFDYLRRKRWLAGMK